MWVSIGSYAFSYLAKDALLEVMDDGAFCQELVVTRQAEQPAQLGREFTLAHLIHFSPILSSSLMGEEGCSYGEREQ